MNDHDNIPTTSSNNRDGHWLDSFGCCKVCDGEIPHGHTPNCDIYKLEQKVTTAERELATVTKERDEHKIKREKNYETARKLLKIACKRAQERDSLRSEVTRLTQELVCKLNEPLALCAEMERLKDILRDCDNTFANGAHAQNPIRVNIQKAINPKGGDELCASTQVRPTLPTAIVESVSLLDASNPAPAQSEPSQVGGKEEAQSHVDAEGCPTESAVLRREWGHLTSDLTAAQATIVELERHIDGLAQLVGESSNATLPMVRGIEARVATALDERDQLRTENAALRARVAAPPQNDLPTA